MAGAKQHPDTARAMSYVLINGYTLTEASKLCGIHRTTLYRALNPKQKKKRAK